MAPPHVPLRSTLDCTHATAYALATIVSPTQPHHVQEYVKGTVEVEEAAKEEG